MTLDKQMSTSGFCTYQPEYTKVSSCRSGFRSRSVFFMCPLFFANGQQNASVPISTRSSFRPFIAVVSPAPKTPQGSRVPDTLRGNFIPLGNASASTPVSTLAQQSNNKRTRGAPARSTGSSNTPATAKRSAQKQGGGRAGTAMLGDTRQNGSNTLSNSLMSVGIVLGGNGSGCVTEQSSIDGAGAKLEAPSLLEQIRKDAKKKRRQEAAAKAASLG